MHDVAKLALILKQAFETIEIVSGTLLDERPPEIDQLLRGGRRRPAGQALAHHQGKRVLDRRVGTVRDFVELAAMKTIVEYRREVDRDAVHAARADGFDPRLLHRLEHRARL